MRSNAKVVAYCVLAGSIALAIALLVPRTRYPLSFDAVYTYLPLARNLLEQGWSFMLRPESLGTGGGPIGFLYPALLGADPPTIRWVNVFLFGATIALGFAAVRLAHSWTAAAMTAFLLAISPMLRPYVADVLTEPPFFFLTAAWAACVAKISLPLGGGPGRGSVFIILGALALFLATLTRPAVMYFAPLMAIVFLLMKERRLAALHGVAFVLIALWVARNAITFGFPAVAAGAGNALFLGVNPLVDGYDPAYFGLTFDEGAAVQSLGHLSIAGDRLLRDIALVELRDTPLPVLAEMFTRKAIAFIFVTSSEVSPEPLALQRAWRVAAVILAVAAVAYRRRSPLVIALAALAGYMVIVHIPVMYHHRYSVGSLDVPLTLLAAIGIAEAAATPARAGAVAMALIIGIGAGLLLLERGPGSPRIDLIPSELIWARNVSNVVGVEVENAERTGPGAFALKGKSAVEIPVTNAPRFHPWDINVVTMNLALTKTVKHSDCGPMRLRYRKPGEAYADARVVSIPLPADGRMRSISVGATNPLALNHEGILRVEIDCAAPATLELGRIAIAAPRRAIYYREKYLKETVTR